ncbi:MAG: hypothetical protein EOP56_13650 [Sphingobacteriales bacterium]|nr:MAG: hypothetical protein EOP56_13650 [Sphingobacteriales bacterium]
MHKNRVPFVAEPREYPRSVRPDFIRPELTSMGLSYPYVLAHRKRMNKCYFSPLRTILKARF